MTILVQQKSDNDCGLAAIAMAAGKKWEDLWDEEDLAQLHGVGMADPEPYMNHAGFIRKGNYLTHYCHGENPDLMANLLSWRRAILSIRSLNDEHSNHMVYWDGERIWDPNEGREGKSIAKQLRSVVISTVHVLKG